MPHDDMPKEEQLKKFGYTVRNRRQTLKMSIRDLSKRSGVSAALICKLENGQMGNFPKNITIELLSKALKFERGELHKLADVLFTPYKEKETFANDKETNIREFLANETDLNAENAQTVLTFIKAFEKLQKIEEKN